MMVENDKFPLISLFQVGNTIHQLNKQTEKKLGLSLVQWCVLKKLIDMPASAAASLAKAVDVHPSTLTQTLRRLERKKYIFIMEDPKDSRKKLISITRNGKEKYDNASLQINRLSDYLKPLNNEINRIQICLKTKIGS